MLIPALPGMSIFLSEKLFATTRTPYFHISTILVYIFYTERNISK